MSRQRACSDAALPNLNRRQLQSQKT